MKIGLIEEKTLYCIGKERVENSKNFTGNTHEELSVICKNIAYNPERPEVDRIFHKVKSMFFNATLY